MELLAQVALNGLAAGSMYALVAIGYNLVYGVLKFINFAHGDVAMVGAYVAFFLTGASVTSAGRLAAALVAAAAFCALVGVVIERAVYRPLRRAPRLQPLIAAIGISLALQSIVMLATGASIRSVTLGGPGVIRLGPVFLTPAQVLIFVTGLLLVAVVQFVIHRTRIGADIRATADNLMLAEALGVDVDRVMRLVFALGSALAGVGGLLVGMEVQLVPTMGFSVGMKAFSAVVLGGIGSLPGAIVGSFIIGLVEHFTAWFTSSVWRETVAYLVLVLTLLVRPSGLFGKPAEEAVRS